jgi:glyoxylase-like metal-dependent hydrolase (beta-lactamase superfamily II)
MIELEWFLLEAGHCTHPEASSRRGAPWRNCEFPALVTVMRHPVHGWILFDTGYGDAFLREIRRFPESLYSAITPVHFSPRQAVAAQLHARGIEPSSVGTVVVSHLHGDHVGALGDFPRARILCSEVAWADLHGRSRWSALAKALLPALTPPSLLPRVAWIESTPPVALAAELAPFDFGFDLLADGSLFAVPLPGHAAGHFGLCFRSGGRWVLLVADAAWSHQAILDNVPPPRWATAFLGNTREYRATLARLHALAVRNGPVTIVPSHCRSLRP